MLRTLLESNAPRQRRRASTAASIVVHTAIIGGAIVATAESAESVRGRSACTLGIRPIYRVQLPRPRPAGALQRRAPRRGGPAGGLPRLTDRPILDFRAPSIPDASADIDPEKLLASASGWGDREAPFDGRTRSASAAGPLGDQPATVATVDRVAALVAPPRPRYPDQLRAAGVTGRVVVRLVVDTTGRVELPTVAIREASHELFADAVRAILPSLRFTPAEVGGRTVRMLVELPFEFRLNE